MDYTLGLLVFILHIACTTAGEYCYINAGWQYCEYDCCGSSYNTYDQYCCSSSSWIVAVAVVGSILFVGAIVLVIFYLYKRKNRQRTIVRPQQGTTITTVYPNQPPVYGYPQQPYPGGSQPPPYPAQPGNQPPSYSGQSGNLDPAYPPPPPAYPPQPPMYKQ